jgi:hypothetical protein
VLGQNRSAALDFSGWYDVLLKLAGVRREKTSDFDIDKVLGVALQSVALRRDSRYYVIRETIGAREIDYTLSSSDSASLSGKLKAQEVGPGQMRLQRSGTGEVSLVGHFDTPARILYKVEEIRFDSSGISGELRVSRLPVAKDLHWQEPTGEVFER